MSPPHDSDSDVDSGLTPSKCGQGRWCCGGKAPLVASLTALALIVVVAFVGLLVVLDRLQLDAANRATTAAVNGALDFTASAVGAVFEDTRVLAVRLARDRQSRRHPSCTNETISVDTANYPLVATMNSSVTPVFAAYDTFQVPGVPQTAGDLTYSLCAAFADVVSVYHSSPPRVIDYSTGDFPNEVVTTVAGRWAGSIWNQTEEPYVEHIRTLRRNSDASTVGRWSTPAVWLSPTTGKTTLYMSVHFPVAFNGPTGEPSDAASVDLFGSGFRPILEKVMLQETKAILVDPRPNAVPSLRRDDAPHGLLLATTFPGVPDTRNRSGTIDLWPAHLTPSSELNEAVLRTAAHHVDGLLGLDSTDHCFEGAHDTVVGAVPVIRPGHLRLVAILVTAHSVFDGNLKRGRRISASVGTACGLICLIALIAFVLISNNAARRLLQHVMSNSGRDIRLAPKDESKPFAIAFTDIQSSTALWARLPQEMGPALDTHHAVIRRCIGRHGGYEVKTIGDSFMVAFENPASAVSFALDVQTELHSACWGADDQVELDPFSRLYHELTSSTAAGNAFAAFQSRTSHPQDSPRCFVDPQLWAGLRVRVGVHYGYGEIKFDETSKGYDYYGTVVNTAARVEAVAHGGQVLVTQDVLEVMCGLPPGSHQTPLGEVASLELGPQQLRGLDDPLELVQLLPAVFAERTFPPLRLDKEAAPRQDISEGYDEYLFNTSHDPADPSSFSTRLSSDGLFNSHKSAEAEVELFESVWRHMNVDMHVEKYIVCCEAIKGVVAALPEKQRAASLATLAKRWRVQRLSRPSVSGSTVLPDSLLIARVMARAAPRVDYATQNLCEEFGTSTPRSARSHAERSVTRRPSVARDDPLSLLPPHNSSPKPASILRQTSSPARPCSLSVSIESDLPILPPLLPDQRATPALDTSPKRSLKESGPHACTSERSPPPTFLLGSGRDNVGRVRLPSSHRSMSPPSPSSASQQPRQQQSSPIAGRTDLDAVPRNTEHDHNPPTATLEMVMDQTLPQRRLGDDFGSVCTDAKREAGEHDRTADGTADRASHDGGAATATARPPETLHPALMPAPAHSGSPGPPCSLSDPGLSMSFESAHPEQHPSTLKPFGAI